MDIGLQAAFLSDSDNDNSLTLVAGAKWAPVQRDRVVLAVAPSFGVDTKAPGNEFAFLPLQLEVGIGDWRVGTEGGYEVLRSDGDTWRIGAYTARQVTPKARMLAELYVQSLDRAVTLQ